MVNYPPYVDSYGQVKELFKKIKEASVPPKFTYDFLSMVLELKSSSFRPMIPFLKKLGFLDENSVPTEAYTEYRDDEKSEIIIAAQLKKTYGVLYAANEYAHRLTKDQVVSKLKSLLGVSAEDNTIPKVAATFVELCTIADFDKTLTEEKKEEVGEKKEAKSLPKIQEKTTPLGISYTINLNLPSTTNIEVFDSIFKSLKENLLR